jgi:hypothetical protein
MRAAARKATATGPARERQNIGNPAQAATAPTISAMIRPARSGRIGTARACSRFARFTALVSSNGQNPASTIHFRRPNKDMLRRMTSSGTDGISLATGS